MKISMLPRAKHFRTEESGIKRVVAAYEKYLPAYGIQFSHPDSQDYDLLVAHAGMGQGNADVAMLHGLYWTADYESSKWEHSANSTIISEIRQAKQVTVPSPWVAESFQRDMRLNPTVIPHGIEVQEWEHNENNEGYVLWNKNRVGDVCSPASMQRLAQLAEDISFVSTFGNNIHNVFTTGMVSHSDMKRLIQKAGVYLSTTKETFGIGVLEAMAAGVPVLGWNYGGNVDLIEHGVNGYLAMPNNFDELLEGLHYCLKYRDTLGTNGRELAKKWTWQLACEKVAEVLTLALINEPPRVDVIIPVYNKSANEIERAIDSCINQAFKPHNIFVIDDGSENEDEILSVVELYKPHPQVKYIRQNNQGVANTRNNGIALGNSKYVCCLDADDWIAPEFLATCIQALEDDRSLHIAYTGLYYHKPDGDEGLSPWPEQWDFDKQLQRKNQIPTCCVFTREMWQRLGGYRQRYAPKGAGSEDAELWTRAGAYGFKAQKVSDKELFHYSWLSGATSKEGYNEPDWLAWHPWVLDDQHPFASYARPENKICHPVRQYDEPVISVIIPVGPGHEKEVINALDSLESQTYRKWEVILSVDTKSTGGWFKSLKKAYPYIKYTFTQYGQNIKSVGAGYARNRGVEKARAPFILFVDADDTLHPQCLERMLDYWQQYESAIYTDYVGHAIISDEYAKQLQGEQRLQSYDNGEAIISFGKKDYDKNRALQQPNQADTYIWCLITTLIPKVWHNEIGGFDENMETWEDWDYWIRMAKAGKNFKRLPEELVRYRLYTSTRRHKAVPETEEGQALAQKMFDYMSSK